MSPERRVGAGGRHMRQTVAHAAPGSSYDAGAPVPARRPWPSTAVHYKDTDSLADSNILRFSGGGRRTAGTGWFVFKKPVVGAIGIEPMTSAMSTQRSYQLSYAPPGSQA